MCAPAHVPASYACNTGEAPWCPRCRRQSHVVGNRNRAADLAYDRSNDKDGDGELERYRCADPPGTLPSENDRRWLSIGGPEAVADGVGG